MALLQRTRILPNERIDKPDYDKIEDFVCADFKAIHKFVWSDENFVISGFNCTGTGTTNLSIAVAGSSFIVGQDDGVMFIGAPSLDPLVTSNLTPGATNYVELVADQDTGGADSRAFWDSTAGGGVGGEFSQIIDTFIFLFPKLNINTSNFTGDPDKVRLCEVDVNGGGTITAIRDARNLFYRLGRSTNTSFGFPWASRTEPTNTQFTGADKDITRMKDMYDALMTEIRLVKGTNFWYEDPGISIVNAFRNSALSLLSAATTTAKFSWSGTSLSITDDSGTPAESDILAFLRLLDVTTNLNLTRQDGGSAIPLADGEALWIQIPKPLANVTYDGIGVVSTNYRVSARGSVPNNDSSFWLAYREGANLYVRGLGELEPGETAEISDTINENILAAIGLASETSMPQYPSNNYVTDNDAIVDAIGDLDTELKANADRDNQDRNLKLIRGGDWTWNSTTGELSFTSDAFIQVMGLTEERNTIDTASSPITLDADGKVAYVEINRSPGANANLTVLTAFSNVLVHTDNTVVIARRIGTEVIVGTKSLSFTDGETKKLDEAANRTLSNLEPTAINEDLLPEADVTKDLGASAFQWAESWVAIRKIGTFGEVLRTTTPSGATAVSLRSTAAGEEASVHSSDNATADANATGNVLIESGNKTAGTGNSGDINLKTGTSAGGLRGQILLDSLNVKVQGTLDLTEVVDSSTTGSDQDVSLPTTSYLKFTNGSLASIRSIVSAARVQTLIITNDTAASFTIKNEDTGATAANRIITGTGADMSLALGASLVLIYDTNDSRWRVVGGSGSGASSVRGFKNYLINTNFTYWERALSGTYGSVSTPASGTINCDRWLTLYDGTIGSFTQSRETFVVGQTDVPDEPVYFFKWDHTSAGSGSTFRRLVQRIDFNGVQTLAGKTVTVAMWMRDPGAQTYSVDFRQFFGTGGSPSADVVVSSQSASVTSTWTRFVFTFTIPSVSGKTIGTNVDTSYLEFRINMPINALFNLELAQVTLNEGGTQDWALHGGDQNSELAACRAYFEKTWPVFETLNANTGGGYSIQSYFNNVNHFLNAWRFNVTKRRKPTALCYSSSGNTTANLYRDNGGGGADRAAATTGASHTSAQFETTAAPANQPSSIAYEGTADAELY